MPRPSLFAFVVLLLTASPAQAATWRWPVEGPVIAEYRNGEDPYAAGQHRGIDIAADVGTPVVAAADGTVRFAGVAGSSGLTVSVRTADGAFDTSYLHLSSASVRKGDAVREGDALGAVGISGRRSTDAPHLHFGVREAGSRYAYRNPLDFLPPLAPPPPAPDVPPSAPVPAPAPVRRAPAPHRVPAARRAPARRRVPAHHPFPAGRPVPAGRRIPAARPVPVARPALVTRRVPARHRAPAPGGHGAPGGARAPLPALPVGPETPSVEGRARSEHPTTVPSGGLDVGWALACLGMLLAAACIGLGQGKPEGPAHRRRTRIAALLGPLVRRG